MAETEERSNRPNVGVVQLAGGALAALSAAVAASTLGVEGTILGAALGSVVASTGGAWYSWSLERTQERLRTSAQTIVATARSKTRSGRSVAAETAAAESAVAADGHDSADGDAESGGNTQPAVGYDEVPDKAGEPGRRPPWRKLAIGAVGAFLIAMAAITVFELATGQPLAATVGNADEKGTSVAPRKASPTPTPSISPTESPSAGPTDDGTPQPTVTQEPTAPGTRQPTPTPDAPSSPAQPTQIVPQETPNG